MSTQDLGLGLTFSARDLASTPIGLLSGNFGRLRNSVSTGMPRIMAGFSVLAAGAISLTAGLDTFRTALDFAQVAGEFDQEMAAVRSITQASEANFNALSAAAVEAGIQTQFAPAQAAGGLRVLSQQGLIATDAIAALVPVLDFAAAGNISVAEAAEVAMGTMNAYGLTVENMTSVTDRLMRGTQISALSSSEFITVMGRAASSGRIFGTNLDDVIVSLGSLRSAGIPATVATTALGEAMRRLTTDTGARQELRRLGVEIETSGGQLRSVIDITRDLQLAIAGETDARQAQIVASTLGVRGMRTFGAIANIQARVQRDGTTVTLRGAEAIAHYRAQLEDAGGTTERFRRDRLATFQGQLTLLTGTVQTFQTVFGHTFGVLFRPIALAVTEGINLISRGWRELGSSTQLVVGATILGAAAFAIIAGAILIFAGGVTLAITLLGELLITVGTVMAGVAIALIPVVIGIGVLIGLAFALREAYRQNLGGIADMVNQVVGNIVLGFNIIREYLTTGAISARLWGQSMGAQAAPVRLFVGAAIGVIQRLREVWSGFREQFAAVWASMGPVFASLQAAFSNLLSQVFGVTRGLADGANAIPFDSFSAFGALLADFVGGALVGIIQGMTRAMTIFVGLTRVVMFLRDVLGPFFDLWTFGTRQIIPLLRVLWRALSAINDVMRWISPVTWITEGLEAIGASGEVSPQERRELSSNPFSALERMERRDESAARSESSSRPAAAEAAGRAGDADDILAALSRSGSRGEGGTRRLDNRITVEVDRNQLAEVLQSINLDGSTGSGQVVTDEFGFPQSRPA